MLIGFLMEDYNIRGSCIAQYDYAHHNERILGNKSILISPNNFRGDEFAFKKFKNRFPIVFYDGTNNGLKQCLENNNIDYLYVITYGRKQDSEKYVTDGICKTLIHCVFDMNEPHGYKYVGVSKSLAKKFNSNQYLHHMISHYPSKDGSNLRNELGIPQNAIVFGRYGGKDTFNLDWSKDVIKNIISTRKDIYFIFMNTPEFHQHNQIKYIPATTDIDEKNKFIMTCDAAIVPERMGHTFGMVCGEFSINNKPNIIYNGHVWNTAHIDIQGDEALHFKTPEEFYKVLNTFEKKEYKLKAYDYYNPENIMKEFKEVFLD
jgi:hypothetical protein